MQGKMGSSIRQLRQWDFKQPVVHHKKAVVTGGFVLMDCGMTAPLSKGMSLINWGTSWASVTCKPCHKVLLNKRKASLRCWHCGALMSSRLVSLERMRNAMLEHIQACTERRRLKQDYEVVA